MKIEKARMSLTAIFFKDPDDGGFTGFFAEIPEVIAEGDTIEEVEEMLFQTLPMAMSERYLVGYPIENTEAKLIPIKKTFNFELATV